MPDVQYTDPIELEIDLTRKVIIDLGSELSSFHSLGSRYQCYLNDLLDHQELGLSSTDQLVHITMLQLKHDVRTAMPLIRDLIVGGND